MKRTYQPSVVRRKRTHGFLVRMKTRGGRSSSVPVAPKAVIASRSDARYPGTARMATPAEFDRCMRGPALHRSGPFALHLCWVDPPLDATSASSSDAPVWRLGLVIPKRLEASAVARNTIKRRWRDAFRRGRAAWAAEFGSVDLVVRMQSPLVPKPVKAKGKADGIAIPVLPARVRARDRFDPSAMLAALIERLRSRGGRPAVAVVADGATA